MRSDAAPTPSAGCPAELPRGDAIGRRHFPLLDHSASLVSGCFPAAPQHPPQRKGTPRAAERRHEDEPELAAGVAAAHCSSGRILRQLDHGWATKQPPWCPTGRLAAAETAARSDHTCRVAASPDVSPTAAPPTAPPVPEGHRGDAVLVPAAPAKLAAEEQERLVQRLFAQAQKKQSQAAQQLRARYTPQPKPPRRLKQHENTRQYDRAKQRLAEARLSAQRARKTALRPSPPPAPPPVPGSLRLPPRQARKLAGEELQEHLGRLVQQPSREDLYRRHGVLEPPPTSAAPISADRVDELTVRLHARGVESSKAAAQRATDKYLSTPRPNKRSPEDLKALVQYLNSGQSYTDRPKGR